MDLNEIFMAQFSRGCQYRGVQARCVWMADGRKVGRKLGILHRFSEHAILSLGNLVAHELLDRVLAALADNRVD